MSASIEFVNIENFSLDIIDRKILKNNYNTIMDEQEISLKEAKTKFQKVVDHFTRFGHICRDNGGMFYYFRNLLSDAKLIEDEKYVGGWDHFIINIDKIKSKRSK